MKIKKHYLAIFMLSILLSISTVSYAASTYAFTYNFTHQLSVKKDLKATGKTAKFSCTTTTDKSKEGYFTIRQYKVKAIGANTLQTSKTINTAIAKDKKSKTSSASFSTTKDVKYSYEFWKPAQKTQIVGSGTVTY